MKAIATIILSVATSAALAAPVQQCTVWDYARLKDSSEKELKERACELRKVASAAFDAMMRSGGDSYDTDGTYTAANAHQACIDQEKAARKAFKERFGRSLTAMDCAPDK